MTAVTDKLIGGGLPGLRMRYLMLLDISCTWLAIVLSFSIRYDALVDIWPYLVYGRVLFILLPLVFLPLYYSLNLYNRLWRYASVKEMGNIVLAGIAGTAILYAINFWLLPALQLPWVNSRSIIVLAGIISTALMGGLRFLLRLQQERYRPSELMKLRAFVQNPSRVLVIGAGDAGAIIVRELHSNPRLGMRAIGLVDDDSTKRKMSIHGVPVLGNRHDIPMLVQKHGINQIIIAMPTAPGRELRDIVRICETTGIQPRTIPGIYELLDNNVNLASLRNVEIEDLLRREPIRTDTHAVTELLRGKKVLVTGAGGSIGSELCRQIFRCRPAELVLLGHGENSIFEIHAELTREAGRSNEPTPKLRPIIADIRFGERILTLLEQTRPDVVFHAAAHKHVPLMEENPAEAVTNNILGTRNVVRAALATDVQRFVMISTDKAVNPTSIMGASKRTAELLVHEAATTHKKAFVAVRFGNVLGSRGSVVLTFKQQIAAGGPVTVTHPEVNRFFMTIPEAVQLVLQAAVLGNGREVFMLDMGEPVNITDLASDLIRLSGYEVGRDIEIKYTGLRPGEKLYEELFVPGERYEPTRHSKVFIAANASTSAGENLGETLVLLEQAARLNDRDGIIRILQGLIPEFQPPQPPKGEPGSRPEPKVLSTLSAASH